MDDVAMVGAGLGASQPLVQALRLLKLRSILIVVYANTLTMFGSWALQPILSCTPTINVICIGACLSNVKCVAALRQPVI